MASLSKPRSQSPICLLGVLLALLLLVLFVLHGPKKDTTQLRGYSLPPWFTSTTTSSQSYQDDQGMSETWVLLGGTKLDSWVVRGRQSISTALYAVEVDLTQGLLGAVSDHSSLLTGSGMKGGLTMLTQDSCNHSATAHVVAVSRQQPAVARLCFVAGGSVMLEEGVVQDPSSASASSLSLHPSTAQGVDASSRWLLSSSRLTGALKISPITTSEQPSHQSSPSSSMQLPVEAASHLSVYVTPPPKRGVYMLSSDKPMVHQYQLLGPGGEVRHLNPSCFSLPSGAKPVKMAFTTDGNWAFVLVQAKLQVLTYRVRQDATLELYGAPLSAIAPTANDQVGVKSLKASSLDMAMHPSGKFLFVSSGLIQEGGTGDQLHLRGYVASFPVRATTAHKGQILGKPSFIQGGKGPSSLSVSPDGRYLLAVNEDAIRDDEAGVGLYSIDLTTGALSLRSTANVPGARLASSTFVTVPI